MLAIIPAKKKSKRLENKNTKILGKKPLIAYTIEAALKSDKIKRVIVSTDCEKTARIAKKYGAEVPFIRPKKLASEKITALDVCKHAINFLLKNQKVKIPSFIVLQPTSPLRLVKDIDKAIEIFYKNNANSVISLTKAKPLGWHRYLRRSGTIFSIFSNDKKNKKSKKNNYIINGAIYIYKTTFINKNIYNSCDKKSFPYIMPKKRSVDIDSIDDFNYAKHLLFKNSLKK